MFRLIDQLDLVRSGALLLDIGCGPGSMVAGLLERSGNAGRYVGFDVHAPAIDWCKQRYRAEPRCRFELARLDSPYAIGHGADVAGYSFPVGDGEADFVLAKSVFTHLMPAEAERYLAEIARALRPGRPAVLTAFLFSPASSTGGGRSRTFRKSDPSGRVRWRSQLRPEAAVAYERGFFEALVEESGLRVQWQSPGFFPGDRDRPAGQDVLVLGR